MKDVLKKIVSDDQLEARWLKTVSILEYIGSRKISKTVAQKYPALEILEHLNDETRHAYAFAKLSEKMGEGKAVLPLCMEEGLHYFQTLDKMLSDYVKNILGREDVYANYLFVTCAIERRAMSLYPYYQSITQHGFVRDELRQVIVEESNHRKPIEDKVSHLLKQHQREDFSECQAIEEKLFNEFSGKIQSYLLENA